MGLPFGVESHISKKLDMPAGLKALAERTVYLLLSEGFNDGNALWHASRIGGPRTIMNRISVPKVQIRYHRPAETDRGVKRVFPGIMKAWLKRGTVAPMIAAPTRSPSMHPIS